ncbi:hypothetical protein ACIBH1_12530 [Nonomuraea sp. NPDC050663]|uniref:hypothetical protein n=1 Tax=Nonomuraea sp. NPDC050663 TaxID=3364370 RepID=UPI0037B597EC
MNLGPTEILLFLAIPTIIMGFGVVLVARSAKARSRASIPRRHLDPHELDTTVQTLVTDGQHIQAIKLVRENTGMRLVDAKNLIDGVARGQSLLQHPAIQRLAPRQPHIAPHGPDLATRVRDLKAAGRTEQAIFLVRGETGMDEEAATKFVDIL